MTLPSNEESKRVLVLLAGGYTKDSIPKHLLRTAHDEHLVVSDQYLFERMIEAIPAQNVVVVTNPAYVSWWSTWKYEFDHRKKDIIRNVSIFSETRNIDGSQPAPVFFLTTTVPASSFSRFGWDEVIVSPIDVYFDFYDFVPKLMKEDEAFVVARYPESLHRYVTIVRVSLRGKYSGVVQGEEDMPIEHGLIDDRWVFTGVFKTKMQTLQKIYQQPHAKLVDMIELVKKGYTPDFKPKFIKHETLYRDYGIKDIYDEGVSAGILEPLKV
jgi:hypothetical protein